MKNLTNYWSLPIDELFEQLGSTLNGLDYQTAKQRILEYGPNMVAGKHPIITIFKLFLEQFRSPLILILIFAAIVALIMHDWLNALIVLGIVLLSAIMSFIQEYRASSVIEKLRKQVAVKTLVVRGGQNHSITISEIVPGDIVKLKAGSLIPGDGVLIESEDLYVNQSLLTGETYPVEKQVGMSPQNASLIARANCVFMGTSVRSGTATALMVHTGRATGFGKIAASLELRPPETEFERGLRHFGLLLVWIMLVIVIIVLAINIVLHHPTIETVMFAMALAVGLSPELLPAILTITLSKGARNLAEQGVIVKHLNAIENLGSMNVLCTDKTGTLTRGEVRLESALDISGQPSDAVFQLAYLNSYFETGLSNPLDEAIIEAACQSDLKLKCYQKRAEIPYDFVRKRLSIVVSCEGEPALQIITKGALENVLAICDKVQDATKIMPMTEEYRQSIEQSFRDWSANGFRVLGVSQNTLHSATSYTREDEQNMVFVGFLLFFDPPEAGVRNTLTELNRLGVNLKIITGDNQYVARHVADELDIKTTHIITGKDLSVMKDEALWHLAPMVNVFAEVDPNQKERIITALQKTGHVVGYLGDGINDAPALHAADVGISVDKAVDVAKEAADFILMKHDLEVLRKGIDEGRHTFANTIKYIFITTSANFGNMISMAVGSLFLPFLPLLAKQILLNNFLSDIPALGIASDKIDRDWEKTPHRWDIKLICNFMIIFGLLSVLFDLITFALLLYLAGAVTSVFRTGWFIESLLTELLVLLVIRTYRPFYKSIPGRFLIWSSVCIFIFTLALPYLSLGGIFELTPLPWNILLAILSIALLYAASTEITKQLFFRHFRQHRG